MHISEVIGLAKHVQVIEVQSVPSETKDEDKTGKRRQSLNDSLLVAIDEALRQVFMKEGTKVIYAYLESKCHSKREQIFDNPEVFSMDLRRLLASAAPVIEKMILENLYSTLDLKFEEKSGCEFSDYIKEFKEKFGC